MVKRRKERLVCFVAQDCICKSLSAEALVDFIAEEARKAVKGVSESVVHTKYVDLVQVFRGLYGGAGC